MKNLRVVGATMASLACAAVMAAPAVAAPSQPAPGYKMGNYYFTLDNDCKGGTVTVQNFDARSMQVLASVGGTTTDPYLVGFSAMKNGAAEFRIAPAPTSNGKPEASMVYHLYITGPQGITILNDSSYVQCKALSAGAQAPKTNPGLADTGGHA